MQPKIVTLINKKSLLKVLLICGLFFLASCQTTQLGIGSSKVRKTKNEITAYKIDYQTGFKLARQICTALFDRSAITEDGSGIRVYHKGNYFTQGTAGAIIYPRLVRDGDDESRTGVIFKVEAFGEGYRYSFVPGFMAEKFFKELDEISKKENLPTINFKNYEILGNASIVDKIPSSIPITLVGYKTFLNNKQDLHPFEGIWSSDEGAYKLGVLYCPDDPQFKYKAFIISADRGNWRPGEIKAKWNSLETNDLCMGDWYAANKLKSTMVFRVSKKLIMSINAPVEYISQVILLKVYPTSISQDMERSGTGFAIPEDGLIVTAYHVVKNTKTIKVYLTKDSFVSAKVVHCNPANDLAVLKIEKSTPSFLQVASMRSVKTGDRVFTIGFPVSSVLGPEPKYTEGVVSSLSGVGGASSFLQISVPIQPGNSGGPLVNERGEVVGIITSTAAILPFLEESGTLPQNVNWAVKSDYLRLLVELPETEEQKYVDREQLITHVKKAVVFIESE